MAHSKDKFADSQKNAYKMGRVGSDMEVKFLPGVGPKRAELLKKELDVSTVGELLRVFPFR